MVVASHTASEAICTARSDGLDTDYKGKADLVTNADRAGEAAIREHITERFPSHSIVGEEDGGEADESNVWYIDPIDGTTMFAHGMPQYSILISHVADGELVAGSAYLPERGTLYYALKGEGAYCNDQPLSVSSVESLDEALLSIEMTHRTDSLETMPGVHDHIVRETHGNVQFYSTGYALAHIAEGGLDGMFLRSLQPWDFGAGAIITREAGGRVTDYEGNESWEALRGGDVVVSNGDIHEEMLSLSRQR